MYEKRKGLWRMWEKIVTLYHNYAGSGLVLGFYVLSLIYLFAAEKRKNVRIFLLYVPLAMLILFFNPLFEEAVYAFLGDEIYYRLLWLLPVVVTIAYAAVMLIRSQSPRTGRIVLAAVLCMIVLGGKFIYQNPYFSRAENIYHMPKEVVHICDAIRVEGREVKAAFPVEMLQYVRQYDPSVCMPYGREKTVERWVMWNADELYTEMNKEICDAEKVAQLSKLRQCHYVILPEGKEIRGSFEDYDFELFGIIDGYCIYQDMTVYIGL